MAPNGWAREVREPHLEHVRSYAGRATVYDHLIGWGRSWARWNRNSPVCDVCNALRITRMHSEISKNLNHPRAISVNLDQTTSPGAPGSVLNLTKSLTTIPTTLGSSLTAQTEGGSGGPGGPVVLTVFDGPSQI